MNPSRKAPRSELDRSAEPDLFPQTGSKAPSALARRSVRELVELVAGVPLGASLDDVAPGRLARMRPAELARGVGVGRRAAERLSAAFELGRRVARPTPDRAAIVSPRAVFEALSDELAGLEREAFVVLLLDGKHRLRRSEIVSLGTLTTSLVHPREVFRPAIVGAAAAIVVAHNHPSGDPEPSAEDLAVTRRLLRSGHLLGVPLLDHVVLGDQRWVSLRERMSFEAEAGRAEP